MASPRIAIIGAGTAGCGAARRAAELGAKSVTLIDKSTPASGSSGRSAGVYNVQTLNPIEIEIRIRCRELFYRLEKERGLPLHRIGVLRMARTNADVKRCSDALELQRGLGSMDAKLIDRAEIKQLVPDLECADVVGALYGPNDGSLDGHLVCSALVDEARDLGARVLNNTQVTGHARHGSVHVLHTDKGDIECDVVINAAGAWAPQIGRLLGHPALVNPEVHEVIRVKLPRKLGYVVPFVNFYMPGSAGEAVYFRQDGPDSLIAGMHTYDSVPGLSVKDPDNYSPPDGDDYLTTVAGKVYERLKVDDLGFREGWFGLYPLSADGVFQVGPYADDSSVLVVAGLGGVGVTSGAILGALAAEWALLGKPVTVPSAVALLPDRKSLAA
jgi:glycine/D-amino acid oxidase-like deaminating enzyme